MSGEGSPAARSPPAGDRPDDAAPRAVVRAVTSSWSSRNVLRIPVATSSTTPRSRGRVAPGPPLASWRRRTMKVLTAPTIGAGALAGLKVALRPPARGVRKGDGNDVELAHPPGVSGVAPPRLSVTAQPELTGDQCQPGILVVRLAFEQLAKVLAG